MPGTKTKNFNQYNITIKMTHTSGERWLQYIKLQNTRTQNM